MTVRLSKSRLIAFRQCPKRLWLEIHRPDLRVEDESARGRFAAGHRVGELAQAQYPDGIMIAPDNNLTQALSETRKLLDLQPRKVLFEATFQAEGLLVRADRVSSSRLHEAAEELLREWWYTERAQKLAASVAPGSSACCTCSSSAASALALRTAGPAS